MEQASSAEESVLKEYPNVTYWLQGQHVLGLGNLILTNERLIFLNRVALEEWQSENMQQLFKEGDFGKTMGFALKLHKENFQIPLPAIVNVRVGVFSFFPFPRLCMRVRYLPAKRKKKLLEEGFWFRIPLYKGLSQIELGIILGWIRAIKSAAKARSH